MHFRYANGVWPNSLALAYVAILYPLSVWGLATSGGLLYMFWCVLLGHTLIICAYLVHECIHNTLFKQGIDNRRLGQALAWLAGAACTPYAILQRKHLRHHADRVDVLAIDCRDFLDQHPRLFAFIKLLQQLHLPAAELLMHALSIAAPFMLVTRRQQRVYVILVLLSRVMFFLVLALIDWKILPGYLLAWLLMLTVLGFMDTFQHSYEVRLLLEDDRVLREFDRDYEQAHTYSNLLSQRYPIINLLVLNFCYHNVHHYRSGIPWYELPATHAQYYQNRPAPLVSLAWQLHNYHHNRIERLSAATKANPAIGAAGVSFLVGV